MFRSRDRNRMRAFTLAELATVVAMVSVAMAIGLGSIVDAVRVQQRNAALALANLTLREQRAQALETRTPHFVKPAPGGVGVMIGTTTFNPVTENCGTPVTSQIIPLAGLRVTGSSICFTQDGNTDDTSTANLTFTPPGTSAALATVSVFPAGTFRWTGLSLFRISGFAFTSISVQSVANSNLLSTQIQ